MRLSKKEASRRHRYLGSRAAVEARGDGSVEGAE